MSGLFVAIVGPSGAGKDTLIRELARLYAGDPSFAVARRVVTRTADANEDHQTLDAESFAREARAGRFALTWAAHGLSYGVPVEVDSKLAAGVTVVCNLSRGAVADARARWSNVFAALVEARPETLAERLAARGREAEADRRSRLERAEAAALFTPDAAVDNDREIRHALEQLYALVERRRRASR